MRKRFFASWALSTIAMAGLSWAWHGFILNDLLFIPRPVELFYGLALLTYVAIGFVLTFAYTYLSMGIGIRLKGFFMGLALGFFLYLVAFVLGVSFKGSGTPHVVVDFLWQMVEQGVGGAIVALVYALAHSHDLATGRQGR